jgi:hypothetical protein
MNILALKFFTTTGCHLCEDAVEEVTRFNGIMEEQGFMIELELVDVSSSEALFARYGERIPVLMHGASNEELAWPFDAQTIYAFVRTL